MTRAQAMKKGWALWSPAGGHNPAIDGCLNPGEGAKLDGGMWMNENDKFVCWDSEFEQKARLHNHKERRTEA